MDVTRSSGALSEKVDLLGDVTNSGQDKTESTTSLSSVSAATHDTSRAKYHMKELGTFAKQLEVSNNSSYCFKIPKGLRPCVHRSYR
jgi:hypothetical protein